MTTMRHIKRVAIALIGGTALLIGLALIVLPGPALLVIPAGLAILAIEFAWARRWLRRARALVAGNSSPGNGAKTGKRCLPRRRPLAALARWWRQKRQPRRPAPCPMLVVSAGEDSLSPSAGERESPPPRPVVMPPKTAKDPA